MYELEILIWVAIGALLFAGIMLVVNLIVDAVYRKKVRKQIEKSRLDDIEKTIKELNRKMNRMRRK